MPFIAVLFLLFSCAHQGSSLGTSSGTAPLWTEGASACDENFELCAVGEGSNLETARAQGVKQLAQFFETKIYSEFQNFSQTEQHTKSDFISGNKREVQLESLVLSVQEELKGITVKANYFNPERKLHYALVSLEKRPMLTELKDQLDDLDGRLIHYYSFKQKRYTRRLLSLLEKRWPLQMKAQILTLKKFPPPVSSGQALELLRTDKTSLIKIYYQGLKAPFETLDQTIKNLLTENYFALVNTPDLAEVIITPQLTEVPEHLNIEGFIKLSFQLSLTVKKQGEVIKNLVIEQSLSGRNHAQVLEKFRPELKAELAQKLDELALE